jgi:hypothetical protein
MKVYIVLEDMGYNNFGFCGVYKTKEEAEARRTQIINENNLSDEDVYIQEEEL